MKLIIPTFILRQNVIVSNIEKMKKQLSFLFGVLCWCCSISSQNIENSPLIHAHNDYLNDVPFFEAYINGAASIEMDIHLYNDELYVAHDFDEIKSTNGVSWPDGWQDPDDHVVTTGANGAQKAAS